MGKFMRCFLFIFFLMSVPVGVFAKAVPPPLGSLKTYSSENGTYKILIEILGYPDNSPSACTFTRFGDVAWNSIIPTTPGIVDISDNGESIVMANWGWFEKGGFVSLSFYDNGGTLLSKIPLGESDSKKDVIRIDATALSSTGAYYGLATHAANIHATKVFLYDYKKGELIWQKDYTDREDMIEVVQMKISRNGEAILMTAQNSQTDAMLFTLLDKKGNVLWQKKIDANFSEDVKNYLRLSADGSKFSVSDRKSKKFITFYIVNGKIIGK